MAGKRGYTKSGYPVVFVSLAKKSLGEKLNGLSDEDRKAALDKEAARLFAEKQAKAST